MAAAYGDYGVFIDWDGDGGLRLNDFEVNYTGWTAHGSTPPDLSISTDQAYSGNSSFEIDWLQYRPFRFNDADAGFDSGRFGLPGVENVSPSFTFNDAGAGFDTGYFAYTDDELEATSPYVQRTLENLTTGRNLTLSLWAYVPTGTSHIHAEIVGLGSTNSTTVNDAWQELTLSFVATSTSHTLKVIPDVDPTTDTEHVYLDYLFITGQFEDITTRTLAKRHTVSFSYGRDNTRALSPVTPSETSLEVLNTDSRFAPENLSSPVAGLIDPGKETLVRTKYNGKAYDLFRGFLDNLEVDPATGTESATFEITDALAFLATTQISTPVYSGLRVGDLIGKVLDELNWPEHKRSLDPGATCIGWWWEEGTEATEAINRLVASEGMPAYCTISPAGDFVFRDRHHRLVDESASVSQATFAASGDEPKFSPPMAINLGWKDVLNSVDFTVGASISGAYQTEGPHMLQPVVWKLGGEIEGEEGSTFSLKTGEVREFHVLSENPFVRAKAPQVRSDEVYKAFNDYTIVGSGTATFTIDRTSGQSLKLTVRCLTGPVVINNLQLRATPLTRTEGLKITLKDVSSIERYGREITHSLEVPWANAHDALAMAETLLGFRSTRLPTVKITVNNGTTERFTQILERDLSDRIRILEPRSFTNHEFHIESISHEISEAGKFHEVEFGCERVPSYESEPFRFDDVTAGFGSGRFGYDGVSEVDTVFILDESLLDQGLLAF